MPKDEQNPPTDPNLEQNPPTDPNLEQNPPTDPNQNPPTVETTTDSEGFTILVMIPVPLEGDLVYAVREYATKTALAKALDLSKLPEGTRFMRGKFLTPKVETKVVVSF